MFCLTCAWSPSREHTRCNYWRCWVLCWWGWRIVTNRDLTIRYHNRQPTSFTTGDCRVQKTEVNGRSWWCRQWLKSALWWPSDPSWSFYCRLQQSESPDQFTHMCAIFLPVVHTCGQMGLLGILGNPFRERYFSYKVVNNSAKYVDSYITLHYITILRLPTSMTARTIMARTTTNNT